MIMKMLIKLKTFVQKSTFRTRSPHHIRHIHYNPSTFAELQTGSSATMDATDPATAAIMGSQTKLHFKLTRITKLQAFFSISKSNLRQNMN